jgi:F420-non-reducing hydrogenase small subunit
MAKPKVAFYWCASCGGCEETVVDLNEDILKVVDAVDIVLWPVALDFKRKDVEALGDKEIAVCFINGAVRTEEQEEMVRLLREKSDTRARKLLHEGDHLSTGLQRDPVH